MKYRHNKYNKLNILNDVFCFIVYKSKLFITIILLFTFVISFENNQRNIKMFQYEIKLLIRGNKSDVNLLSDHFYKEPSIVLVNGVLNSSCKKKCYFENESNNVTIKFEELLDTCEYMFNGLTNINEIDFSNLDTSKVKNMSHMFNGCTNLERIYFGNINTSLVQDMNCVFTDCKKLEFIDLSNFDTSSVTNMRSLFYGCESLKSIDVSKFNTSKVENMHGSFAYCYNLTSLNISNFDTSKVTTMQGMFYLSSSLKYLDLSNFNTSKVTNMEHIFQKCRSLLYLDISNFSTTSDYFTDSPLLELNSLIILNLNSFEFIMNESIKNPFEDLKHNILYCSEDTNLINYMNNSHNNCSDLCFQKNIKIILKENRCIEYCRDSDSKFEYGNICYDECPIGFPILINDEYKCLHEIPKYYYLDIKDDIYKYKQNIYLKVTGKNQQNILYNYFYLDPFEVWINGVLNNCTKICNLGNDNNDIKNITISFDKQLESFENIFYGLTNIKEIDLSNLDTSKVKNMLNMFNGCKNLERIYFGNINTSLVQNMENLFRGCNKLESIDLSNFDTSSVTTMQSLFHYCHSLKSIDVSNFNTSNVENMFGLFANCYNLTSLNISNFDTSKVTNMQGMFCHLYNITYLELPLNTSKVENMMHMFENTNKLTSLDISSFNTSSVKTMRRMFVKCYNLKSIDLSNFDTSSVTNMQCLFQYCHSLKSIDVSKFNTSNVENMYGLFANCYNLTSLNISNFDTSKVTDMQGMFCHLYSITYLEVRINTSKVENMMYMFENTNKLTSLDISSFNTSSVTTMKRMFYQCNNLKSIDLSKFDTSKVENLDRLFAYCYQLTSLDLSNFDTSSVTLMELMFYHCENLKLLNISKFNTSKVDNLSYLFAYCHELTSLDLSSFETSNITNMIGIFYNLYNLKYLDLSNFNTSNVNEMQFLFYQCYSLIYLNLKNFKIDDTVNYSNIFYDIPDNVKICIDDIDTTNLLLESKRYSDCSDICFKDNSKIDLSQNKCVEYCNETQNIFEYNKFCYERCPFGYQILINDIYKCVYDIPEDLCLDETENIYKECNSGICIYQNSNGIISYNENKCYFYKSKDDLNKDMLILFNREINLTELESGNDIKFSSDNIYYTITTTSNQRNNFGKENITYINLGDCEKKLKEKYGIPQHNDLYIYKLDVYLEGMKIPKVEYEVYYPLYDNNLTKLDLSKCKDIKMDIFVPIDIAKDDLDKHNSSSGYYNDICYTLTSEKGTDKALKDRKDEFIDKNMTVCEENCEFTNYNETQKIGTCSCYVKFNLPLVSEIKIDRDLLISNFKDVKNIANIKMLKCLNLFFDKKNIFKNYANYLFILLSILSFISVFVFSCSDYQKIKDIANEMNNTEKSNSNIISNTNNINNSKKTIRKRIIKKNNNNNNAESKIKIIKNKMNKKNEIKINQNRAKSLKFKNKSGKEKTTKLNVNNNIISNNPINLQLSNKKKKKKKILITNNDKDQNNKNESNSINKYIDYELNNLEYEEAIKIDNRSYCQYYISLIRTKHLFILSFITNNDYNSKIVKIYLFFFNFAINYSISAMFYSETMMHQIYIDSGAFNFVYQLPEIIYSAIITAVLNLIITTLGLSQDNIINIKKNKKEEKNGIIQEELNKIKLKSILFFIITYILLFFFWIYLGCFCAVYKNTQTHLLKEVSSSFASSLITPFFVNLLPGLFRIPALNKNRSCLYKFSTFLQIL